jgi:hypothetical protein
LLDNPLSREIHIGKKIAILLHENDPCRRHGNRSSLIWHLCAVWQQQEIEVEVVNGVGRHVDADLLFSHLTLSQVPDRYAEFRSRYPVVVNGGVHDITKRYFSTNLVQPGDGYTGPVIIKTNRNYGGLNEYQLGQEALAGRRFAFLRSSLNKIINRSSRRFLRLARTLDVNHYPVYSTVASVPPGVFKNEALVVEKFLPERDGELYCLRVYVFLGDRHINFRVKSSEPIVKRNSIVSREEVPVPEEIVAARRRLNFDYGKFDYVINEGRVVLLDTNSTPGGPPRVVGTSPPIATKLADGIWSLRQPVT